MGQVGTRSGSLLVYAGVRAGLRLLACGCWPASCPIPADASPCLPAAASSCMCVQWSTHCMRCAMPARSQRQGRCSRGQRCSAWTGELSTLLNLSLGCVPGCLRLWAGSPLCVCPLLLQSCPPSPLLDPAPTGPVRRLPCPLPCLQAGRVCAAGAAACAGLRCWAGGGGG